MPGYTHLQSAQPLRWSHWMLSHATAWRRDALRLAQAAERLNECPLGSGALAGNPFGVDRVSIAADLGFDRPTANSIDAVRHAGVVAAVDALSYPLAAGLTFYSCR